jgi:hypothetical protein
VCPIRRLANRVSSLMEINEDYREGRRNVIMTSMDITKIMSP